MAKNENNFETLDKVANGLYATPTTELPFDKRFRFKSFVLERSEGNIVIFHSGRIDEAADDIRALGGADRVLMNHEHESLGGQMHFDAPYYIHQDDKEAVTDTLQIAGTFKDREQLYDDLEVIPAPGIRLEQHYIYGITANIVIYLQVISSVMKEMSGAQSSYLQVIENNP